MLFFRLHLFSLNTQEPVMGCNSGVYHSYHFRYCVKEQINIKHWIIKLNRLHYHHFLSCPYSNVASSNVSSAPVCFSFCRNTLRCSSVWMPPRCLKKSSATPGPFHSSDIVLDLLCKYSVLKRKTWSLTFQRPFFHLCGIL